MIEIWKPSPSFPDYEVSSLGRVRSHKRGGPKLLNPKPDVCGRVRTALILGNRQRTVYVHQLVAEAFLGQDDRKVYHLDGNRSNNHADNLAYGTCAEIITHRQKLGLWPSGESTGNAKLTDDEAHLARSLFASGKQTQNELANHYGVSRVAMNLLLRGKTYPNAGGPVYKSQRADKAAILKEKARGDKIADIAARHGISESYVSKIWHRKR